MFLSAAEGALLPNEFDTQERCENLATRAGVVSAVKGADLTRPLVT